MAILLKLAAGLFALYALVVLGMWLGQRRLIYPATPSRVAPEQLGLLGVRELELRTPDGAMLVAWRMQARTGQPTLLYFHGNGGNLADRADRVRRYQAAGLGLLMPSYRGYSGSSGTPSEAVNVADASRAYDRLIADGVAPEDIVLYGESLGSGIAVQLAAMRRVGAVVLDAPYTSMVEMASLRYPFLPIRPLLADRYESNRVIAGVSAPVLVMHGVLDRVIPVEFGKKLFAAANEPKKLAIFPAGGHSDLDQHGAVEVVRAWLTDLRRIDAGR